MKVYFTEFNDVHFDAVKNEMVSCSNNDFVRYLKGLYTNKERFINRYLNPLREKTNPIKNHNVEFHNTFSEFIDYLGKTYNEVKPFSFKEAFDISNKSFQGLVFSSINIGEMIEELGAKRIKTDGIESTHRQYDSEGNFTGEKTYHNIYEVHEVSGEKLGLNENLYVVKCWCTSTNKEHWLWIEDQYKDDPLTAIASTFRVHENIIPHIKCLKRQGDLLLIEMDEKVKPEGNIVPLTKEQYFGLLVAQS